MKKWIAKGTMSAMLVCSPFLVGTAAYADTIETVNLQQAETETKPALVQGDFFYFVKTTVEKIRLALETNNLEEAKLLSEQAAERIAEAKVLLQEGKEQYVQQTLTAAADKIEEADELTTEKETEASKGEVAEVQIHLGHNVEALAKVLDKVKNPKAKAAIVKNIEKSFKKWSVRIVAVQAETNSEAPVVVEDDKAASTTDTTTATDTAAVPAQPEASTENTAPAAETKETAATPAPVPAPVQTSAPAAQHDDDEDEDEDEDKEEQVKTEKAKKEKEKKEKKEKEQKEKSDKHKENKGQGKGHDKHND